MCVRDICFDGNYVVVRFVDGTKTTMNWNVRCFSGCLFCNNSKSEIASYQIS